MYRVSTNGPAYRFGICMALVFLSCAGLGCAPVPLAIETLQQTADAAGNSPYVWRTVVVSGTVTAAFVDGYVVAEAPGAWKAVYVHSISNGPEIGDDVEVTGRVEEHEGMTRITNVTSFRHISSGNPVEPTLVSVAEAIQEQYESVLISLEDVAVTDLLDYGEWVVTDGRSGQVLCDDKNDYAYFPEVGDPLEELTGVLFYTHGAFKLQPRTTSDIAGDPIPHYAIHGDVVTMNNTRDIVAGAYIEILGDRIAEIHAALPPGIPVVHVSGLVFPGLIDSHNHPSFNVLDIIPFGRLFTERYEWQATEANASFQDQLDDIRDFGGPNAQVTNIWKLAEVRALTAGTTAIQGANCNGDNGFAHQGIGINNVERFPARVYHTTFPLRSTSLFQSPSSMWSQKSREYWDRFIIHLSEGTSAAALDEFYQWQGMAMLDARTSIIHGVPLGTPEWAAMAAVDANLIWSPISNLMLYGTTADIPGALAAGVNVALAPDWTESGGRHLLEELQEANRVNEEWWEGVITPLQFAEFVTRNAAKAAGAEEMMGQIAPGFRANLMAISREGEETYEVLLDAEPADVQLTIVDGRPMYGDPAALMAFSFVDGTESIIVGGFEKSLSIQVNAPNIPEADKAFSQVLAELQEAYDASEPKICAFLGIE